MSLSSEGPQAAQNGRVYDIEPLYRGYTITAWGVYTRGVDRFRHILYVLYNVNVINVIHGIHYTCYTYYR